MSAPMKPRRPGPRPLVGNEQAKRYAAVILEVLAGLRTVTAGAEALEITAMRYHVLERRALEGMVQALAPRAKGRQRRPEDAVHQLKHEKVRLEREVGRLQALVRAAERTMRLPPLPSKKKGEGRRVRRPQVRAEKTIALLQTPPDETTPVV